MDNWRRYVEEGSTNEKPYSGETRTHIPRDDNAPAVREIYVEGEGWVPMAEIPRGGGDDMSKWYWQEGEGE